jgi:hypothetical protein
LCCVVAPDTQSVFVVLSAGILSSRARFAGGSSTVACGRSD